MRSASTVILGILTAVKCSSELKYYLTVFRITDRIEELIKLHVYGYSLPVDIFSISDSHIFVAFEKKILRIAIFEIESEAIKVVNLPLKFSDSNSLISRILPLDKKAFFLANNSDLFLLTENDQSHTVNFLDVACQSKCMAFSENILFLSGDMCNSMFVKVDSLERTEVDSFSPILSLSLSQGNTFISCGRGSSSSIRKLENGIEINTQMSSDPLFKNVQEIWSLKKHHADKFHSFVAISFIERTVLIAFGLDGFEDVSDICGITMDESSLSIGNTEIGSFIVQVTKSRIVAFKTTFQDSDVHEPVLDFKPDYKITLAAQKGNLIAIYSAGRCSIEIFSLSISIQSSSISIESKALISTTNVSCLSIWKLQDQQARLYCVFGTFDGTIMVYEIASTSMRKVYEYSLQSLSLDVTCVPECFGEVDFDSKSFLVGLRNGIVVKIEFETISPAFLLKQTFKQRFGVLPARVLSFDNEQFILSDTLHQISSLKYQILFDKVNVQISCFAKFSDLTNSMYVCISDNCLKLITLSPEVRQITPFPFYKTVRNILQFDGSLICSTMTKSEIGNYYSDMRIVSQKNGKTISKYKMEHSEVVHEISSTTVLF